MHLFEIHARSESFGQCIVVAFEKRYHRIPSDLGSSVTLDIPTKEECVLECFKPGMAVRERISFRNVSILERHFETFFW